MVIVKNFVMCSKRKNFTFTGWIWTSKTVFGHFYNAKKEEKQKKKEVWSVEKQTSCPENRRKIIFFPLDSNYNTNLYEKHWQYELICIVRMDETVQNGQ